MNPAGANLEYPRTLPRAAALPDVRASLAAPNRLAIYQTPWADVQTAPPGDNATPGGPARRAGGRSRDAGNRAPTAANGAAARTGPATGAASRPRPASNPAPRDAGWGGWLANSFVGSAPRSISRRWHRAFATCGRATPWDRCWPAARKSLWCHKAPQRLRDSPIPSCCNHPSTGYFSLMAN